MKRAKEIFYGKILRITIVIEIVLRSEDTLMHSEGQPSNYFPALSHTIRLIRLK